MKSLIIGFIIGVVLTESIPVYPEIKTFTIEEIMSNIQIINVSEVNSKGLVQIELFGNIYNFKYNCK